MISKPTIQQIFQEFYPEYIDKYNPTFEQQKVARNILNCKTGAYGANVSECENCGTKQIHYNSCRNRCCPMCQAITKEKWIDKRREDVIEAPYFHVVFTVPEELNIIIYHNQKLLYDLLYKCAAETLSELAKDKKYLGAEIGYISILHTWGSSLVYHPHLHVIVLGGGLDEGNRWKDKGSEFFLPVKVIGAMFRGKYMQGLKELWKSNHLVFHGDSEKYRNHYEMQSLIDDCYRKTWIPYSKKTFNGAMSVINYLGRYTHRIAISNNRIISMDEKNVTFRYKDYKDNGTMKEMTVTGVEFIRRFLMHVPPRKFVRIRHYGVLSTRSKGKKLVTCRNQLGCKKYLSRLKGKSKAEIIKILYQVDICICKSCGHRLGESYQVRCLLE